MRRRGETESPSVSMSSREETESPSVSMSPVKTPIKI